MITPVCNPEGIAFSMIQYIIIPVFVNGILMKKAFFLKKNVPDGWYCLALFRFL